MLCCVSFGMKAFAKQSCKQAKSCSNLSRLESTSVIISSSDHGLFTRAHEYPNNFIRSYPHQSKSIRKSVFNSICENFKPLPPVSVHANQGSRIVASEYPRVMSTHLGRTIFMNQTLFLHALPTSLLPQRSTSLQYRKKHFKMQHQTLYSYQSKAQVQCQREMWWR
jgi:hypothetical protein